MRTGASRSLTLAILVTVVLATGNAQAGEYERTFTFDADELVIANLIGTVEVIPATGDAFEVVVSVRGDDAAEDLLAFEVDDQGDARLAIVFPVDEERNYVYPPMGRNSKSTFGLGTEENGGSWLKKILTGGGRRITVRGKGRGLEIWADVTVAVPRGSDLNVVHGLGEVTATDVKADLNLDTRSGRITVRGVEGDVVADTGSGSVEVANVRGDLVVDTGSGGVTVEEAKGAKVHVDTGSGGVDLRGVACDDLVVDTGSGGVRAHDVKTDNAEIDTGSGSVVLELVRMGSGRFVVDTGSGGIEVSLPENASARIEADTGSGRVRNHIENADIQRLEKDELVMTVGDGEARVTLDAGSGSITIRPI